jgi:NADH-quinone oxidoreductase subunit L
MEGFVVLAILLPVTAALLTWSSASKLRGGSVRISIIGTVATFACTAFLLGLALAGKPASEIQLGTSWGILLFDPLSALMAFVVSGISLLVHVYSIRYMAEEPCPATTLPSAEAHYVGSRKEKGQTEGD